MKEIDSLAKLQEWYFSMCNGDWEHTYGITIETLDNPGWDLQIELTGTGLESVKFKSIKRQRVKEDDWFVCKKEGSLFIGYCGPQNLSEVIEVFIEWTEKNYK